MNRFVEFVCVIRRIFVRSCIEIDSSKKALPLVVINLVSCNAGSMNALHRMRLLLLLTIWRACVLDLWCFTSAIRLLVAE